MSNKRNIKLAKTVLNTKSTAKLDEEVKKILDANIADPPKFAGGPPFCQHIPPHTICGIPYEDCCSKNKDEDEDTKEPE